MRPKRVKRVHNLPKSAKRVADLPKRINVYNGGHPNSAINLMPALCRVLCWAMQYRGTSLIRKLLYLGPYSGTMPMALWWPRGGGEAS